MKLALMIEGQEGVTWPQWLAIAQSIRGYIDAFLMSTEGGFYATQDADLNAHDRVAASDVLLALSLRQRGGGELALAA